MGILFEVSTARNGYYFIVLIIFESMFEEKTLIVVVGPTAVGKTTTSIELAKNWSTEIVSADSRQFYKELTIGTAKPSIAELNEIKHHLIDNLSIHDAYTVNQYEKDALSIINVLFQSKDQVIVTGGSGLYINAICHGIDEMPQVDNSVRKELQVLLETEGIATIRQRLSALDPSYYAMVDINNPQRMLRALEICVGTGMPFSSFLKGKKKSRPFKIIKIGLEMDREQLYNRINLRVDEMIEKGLFEEVKALISMNELNALQTVGYKEIMGYFQGQYDREEAIRLVKRNSRRYAKRQFTWFRKDQQIKWFDSKGSEEIQKYLETSLH